MRQKQLRLVITFHTTSDVMAMEKICEENHAPGRTIPVPNVISAGCGLCWSAEPGSRDELLQLMHDHHLEPEGVYNCVL